MFNIWAGNYIWELCRREAQLFSFLRFRINSGAKRSSKRLSARDNSRKWDLRTFGHFWAGWRRKQTLKTDYVHCTVIVDVHPGSWLSFFCSNWRLIYAKKVERCCYCSWWTCWIDHSKKISTAFGWCWQIHSLYVSNKTQEWALGRNSVLPSFNAGRVRAKARADSVPLKSAAKSQRQAKHRENSHEKRAHVLLRFFPQFIQKCQNIMPKDWTHLNLTSLIVFVYIKLGGLQVQFVLYVFFTEQLSSLPSKCTTSKWGSGFCPSWSSRSAATERGRPKVYVSFLVKIEPASSFCWKLIFGNKNWDKWNMWCGSRIEQLIHVMKMMNHYKDVKVCWNTLGLLNH